MHLVKVNLKDTTSGQRFLTPASLLKPEGIPLSVQAMSALTPLKQIDFNQLIQAH